MDTSNKPIVFLHGFLLDSSGWEVINTSVFSRPLIFLDLPGHGKNKEIIPEKEQISAYADWLENEIKQREITHFDLVGHSMGGYIGLEMLQRTSSGMDKLVLFHSNYWEDSDERKKNRDRIGAVVRKNVRIFLNESIPLLFHIPEKYPSIISDIINRAAAMHPDAIVHSAQSMKNRTNHRALVAKHKDRVYSIQGEFDNLISSKESEEDWPGHYEHFSIQKNCGHMSHIEQPDASAETLLKMLEN